MTVSPLAFVDSLRIGTIDFVSPDEIKVLLNIEAPESVAINTGTPRAFPRINSYVLIPSDDGYLVGQVEWITIERSQYPKRQGMKDFGLVDLPFPLRKMSLNPLGSLLSKSPGNDGEDNYSFRRGVDSFPSVGDSVLLPTQSQLQSIVKSGDNRRVKIGTSALAGNADVMIDPNRLFGRHLAVLGNTGSGKSCSVAGLIRWSLEAAQKELPEGQTPNARFIVLDPNGEYSRAFADHENVRIFAVEANGADVAKLQVPLWFWNSSEWSAFTQASGKTQRPILRRALREIKSGRSDQTDTTLEEKLLDLRRYFSSKTVTIRGDIRCDTIKNEATKFGYYLKSLSADIDKLIPLHPDLKYLFDVITENIESALTANYKSFSEKESGKLVEYYVPFAQAQILMIEESINNLLAVLGGVIYQDGPEDDCPISFDGAAFADHLEQVSIQENVSQYLDYLVLRIRSMLSDSRMKSITGDSGDITLHSWLKNHVGDNRGSNGPITIIDLSLVPADVIHLITAVIGRMTLESLQRYRKVHSDHKALPTVMVMEEAHTFIRRYKEDSEDQNTSAICCQVFEKIAREGRKFGLGLVLSSQRPSELSPTVLSQCNSFLLHRISNDRDQELVKKLVPDNLRGLLRDLPSLPAQNAILLGWASELPVMVKMNFLPKNQQPQSDDPDFWEVWTHAEERDIDWKAIADDWQQISSGVVTEDEAE